MKEQETACWYMVICGDLSIDPFVTVVSYTVLYTYTLLERVHLHTLMIHSTPLLQCHDICFRHAIWSWHHASTASWPSLKSCRRPSLSGHVFVHVQLECQKALQAVQHLNLAGTPATAASESPLLCSQSCCLGQKLLQICFQPTWYKS